MYDIITIGSSTIDIFVKTHSTARHILRHATEHDVCLPIGAKVLVDDIHVFTGGGGTNTAVALARLGFKTAWHGTVGTDDNGHTIFNELRKEHVTRLAQPIRGRTGLSVILTGLEHDRTILAFKGVNDKLTDARIPRSRWLYIGSMLGTSWKTTLAIIQKARKNHTKIAFNPSMYLAKQGVQKLWPVLHGLDVLVLNKEEARALLRKPNASVKELLRKLSLIVNIPVITDGANGASATEGEFMFTIKPRTTIVVESTGAGDAFASGFVAGQLLGKNIIESLKLGQAEATGVLSAIGAKNKLLTRKQALANAKREKVTVHPL